jgi:hypothetical protein
MWPHCSNAAARGRGFDFERSGLSARDSLRFRSLWREPRQREPPQRRQLKSRVPDVWQSSEARVAAIGTDGVSRRRVALNQDSNNPRIRWLSVFTSFPPRDIGHP